LHSSFKKNQKIILMFKNGTKLTARYKDTKSGIIITDQGKFRKSDLRSTNIFKNPI